MPLRRVSEMRNAVLQNQYAKQTIFYYIVRVVDMLIGAVQTWILGRWLGADGYGVYMTFITVTGVFLLFFRFGFVVSTQNLIANTDEKRGKEILGASFIIALINGTIFALTMFVLGFFIDSILNVKIGKYLILFSPLLVGFMLRTFMYAWGSGTNRIISMSSFLLVMRLLEIGIMLFLFFVLNRKSVYSVIVAVFCPMWVSGVGFVMYLRPVFVNFRENFKAIWKVNREFGLKVYMGQIADQTTFRLDKLFLAYFRVDTTVGNYSLADAGTRLIVDFPAALSSSLYRSFAKRDSISPRVFRVTIAWLFFSLAGIYIFAPSVVEALFSDAFLEAVPYIYPLGIAGFFQGLYQPINSFLSCKGKGAELRLVSFTEAGLNLIGNIIFIKLYGAMGACWVSASVKFVDFLMYILFYWRYINGKAKNPSR